MVNHKCPFTGKPVDGKNVIVYKGLEIGVCGTGCSDKALSVLDKLDAVVMDQSFMKRLYGKFVALLR